MRRFNMEAGNVAQAEEGRVWKVGVGIIYLPRREMRDAGP